MDTKVYETWLYVPLGNHAIQEHEACIEGGIEHLHVGDDLFRLLLLPVHLVDPGGALGPVISKQRGLVLAAVEEVDGALDHSDGPLGDVVGDVGEVGRGEGEAPVK